MTKNQVKKAKESSNEKKTRALARKLGLTKPTIITSICIITAAIITGIVGPIIKERITRTPVRVVLREKSARELLNYLESLPPLQRETVIRDSYIGRWVRWEGKVQSVSSTTVGFQIGVLESDGNSPWTFISFSKKWLHKIEAIRKDDLIKFEGMIVRIVPGCVNLANVELLPPSPNVKK